MSDTPIYVQDVRDLQSLEQNSILSKTLQNDERYKNQSCSRLLRVKN